jgi:uncharacterized protein YycO
MALAVDLIRRSLPFSPPTPRPPGRQIGLGELRQADIIATTHATSTTSKVIRAGTLSPYSHTILYTGNGDAIDATGEAGVKPNRLSRLIDDKHATLAVVYRHRKITPTLATEIVRWALEQENKPYDFLGAARAGVQTGASASTIPGALGPFIIITSDGIKNASQGTESAFYCSELIYWAYQQAGIPISNTPSYISTPAMIERVHSLYYVGHLKGL